MISKPPVGKVAVPTAHRVSMADLAEIDVWLVKRVCEKFPEKSPQAVRTWLYGMIGQNETLFIRAGTAVAMMQFHTPFLGPRWVEEIFVLSMTEDTADACGLWQDIMLWARSKDANYIDCLKWTDLTRPDIAVEIGKVWRLATSRVWIRPAHDRFVEMKDRFAEGE